MEVASRVAASMRDVGGQRAVAIAPCDSRYIRPHLTPDVLLLITPTFRLAPRQRPAGILPLRHHSRHCCRRPPTCPAFDIAPRSNAAETACRKRGCAAEDWGADGDRSVEACRWREARGAGRGLRGIGELLIRRREEKDDKDDRRLRAPRVARTSGALLLSALRRVPSQSGSGARRTASVLFFFYLRNSTLFTHSSRPPRRLLT